MMIDTTEKLQEVCTRFAQTPFVCVDTEFVREKTFLPELCLIQIATETEAFCVDPLADGMDLTPLLDLMVNPQVVKVFHAARQDIEIFYHLMGRVPTPLFDTQIGAMVCGFRDSVSYQEVVRHYTNISLDKSMRFTDWKKRPLSDKQAKYALADVTHLSTVYLNMKAELEKSGRLSWIEEEMAELSDTNLYAPSDAYICARLKYPIARKEHAAAYQAIYLWREHKARAKNRPRRHIMRDDLMTEIAALRPKTADELKELRGISHNFEKSALATEVLSAIRKAATEGPAFPLAIERGVCLTRPQKTILELLKMLLALVCEENGIAAKLVADTADLTDFVVGQETRFTTGWRGALFGKYATLLKNGKLLVGYDVANQKIRLIESD